MLTSFYSVMKLSALPSLRVINRNMFETRWDIFWRLENQWRCRFCPKKKTSLQMKLTLILAGNLISKISSFFAQKTHIWSYWSQCTHYEWQFHVFCEAEIPFFKNEDAETITLCGDIYGAMITDSFVPAFHGSILNEVWLQHLIPQSIYNVDGRLIRQNGDINWPLTSCDLTLSY